ncbi:MAG: porin family protein [Bacteroidota bacterium]
MKYLMKPLPLIVILILSLPSLAQHITFTGGLNVSDMEVKYGEVTTDIEKSYKMKPGFHVGMLVDLIIYKKINTFISVEPGLLFDMKGVDQDAIENESDFTQINKFNLYYLDIPILVKYQHRFRNLNKLYFGVGPYIGAGLLGKKEYTYAIINGENQTKFVDVKWGFDSKEDDMKRFDYGVSAKVGFLFDGGLNCSVSYDYGIPNVAAASHIKTYKHRLIRLSAGYYLKFD